MPPSSHHGFNACLTDYLRLVYCQCPRCGDRGLIQAEAPYAIPWKPTGVVFTCPACAHGHGWPLAAWTSDFERFDPAGGVEPYFGYRLWAVGHHGEHALAILNLQHADDLAAYLGLKLRPRPANAHWAMVNRLPRWMLLARNRERVLRLIAELRARVS